MSRRQGSGSVRIIGGQWRGRRLTVVDAPGLRPSGDRVRETLFNWLQGRVDGARCADLYAGTGVLGLEAASRGARDVVLIEKSAAVASSLRDSAQMLGAGQVSVVHGDALEWLKAYEGPPLDLVFIDPPFGTDLALQALEFLALPGRLAPDAAVYLESPAGTDFLLPGAFRVARDRRHGDVRTRLLALTRPEPR